MDIDKKDILEAQLLAIKKFAYFRYNYPNPREMCNEIWGIGFMADHFYHKLSSYDFDMSRFYVELSGDNQRLFAEYIINKYHGVK